MYVQSNDNTQCLQRETRTWGRPISIHSWHPPSRRSIDDVTYRCPTTIARAPISTPTSQPNQRPSPALYMSYNARTGAVSCRPHHLPPSTTAAQRPCDCRILCQCLCTSLPFPSPACPSSYNTAIPLRLRLSRLSEATMEPACTPRSSIYLLIS